MQADDVPNSEDRLTLNVWWPAADDSRFPVMVWIYGGSLAKGASLYALDATQLSGRVVHDNVIGYQSPLS